MAQFFVKSAEGRESGPYSAADLKAMAASGKIHPDASSVRMDGKLKWHPARSVRGLFNPENAQQPTAVDAVESTIANSLDVVSLPPALYDNPLEAEPLVDIELDLEPDVSAMEFALAQSQLPVSIQQEWTTPAGNQRKTPVYVAAIENRVLGTSKTIRKANRRDVENAAAEQVRKWNEQVIRAWVEQERNRLLSIADERAHNLTHQAKNTIARIRSILRGKTDYLVYLDWNDYYDTREYPEFTFTPPPPAPSLPPEPKKPEQTFADKVAPILLDWRTNSYTKKWQEWDSKRRTLEDEWQRRTADWETQKNLALEEYHLAQARFQVRQKARNDAVDRFRRHLAASHPRAIELYLTELLGKSHFPPAFHVKRRVTYDQPSQTAIVDVQLPHRKSVTDVLEYHFQRTARRIVPVFMKQDEHEQFYDDAAKQVILRTAAEIFVSFESSSVEGVVVNGWVTYLDEATGHDKTSCVISVSTNRQQFASLALDRVEPAACIKSLKGIVAGPLSQIAPVKPIMHFDRSDDRFIEAQEVLAELNSRTNLAEIGWEEFEHLVRELFGKMFSDEGAEVKITQTSSDGGVDAVVFDPDPIRGGKYVIQAKRYTNVVPVSAIRDLYGTMIAEGASKGILVTTAHFGRDSRDFAKDKPISLIDGSNLVYLLEKHGHKVTIDIDAARQNRDRNPLARKLSPTSEA